MPLNIRHNKPTWTVASDWPDATNTGTTGSLTAVPGSVSSGTGWAWDSGDGVVEITGNGATFEGYDVAGPIIVTGTGVTVNNCEVDIDNLVNVWVFGSGATISNCTLSCINGIGQTCIILEPGSDGTTIEYCDFSGFDNGIGVSSENSVIQHNYFHDPVPWNEIDDPHIDGIQMFDNEADGTTIYHNSMLMGTEAANACIIMGPAANVTIDNNKMREGNFVVYLYYADTNELTNNRIANTVFAGNYWTNNDDGPGTPVITGNVDDDTGDPIP